MAVLTPTRTLFKDRRKPFHIGLYEIDSADNNDTIELPDFIDTVGILTATIVNMRDGATVTQGAISNNVLVINDATILDTPILILAYGWMVPFD